MKIRRVLTLGLAAGALVLAGCTTGEGEGGGGGGEGGGGGGGGVEAGDIRIDVVTHAAPGDSFWDVVKAGSDRAGEDLGIDVRYNSSPDPGEQSTLIDNAVADGTGGLVVSMANPDGLQASIQAAVDAGIPVITINSGIDDWEAFGAITHVGQSETIAGEAAGQQLSDAGLTNVICVIQEPGNVALEERCRAAASTFGGSMKNLQTDNTDLAGSQATIESQLSADDSIDGILALGGDMAGRSVAAVEASGRDVKVGTFDLNADVAKLVQDGSLLFAIDQQPYVQGYLGVTGVYLKLLNGNDIGGGEPVYSGPAIINQENAESVLEFAENGTR
ncbi:MAG TPA: substrate-binding domain-containing protein [Nocardioidaceae bacterium]|nr:substrate-binding domain-containing protein [Nocardioidaceae bacterium]